MNALAYHPRDTPLYKLDARAKILGVLAYSIALLCVRSWWALGLLAALFALAAALGRLPVARALRQLAPLGLILLFTVFAPAFPEGAFSGDGLLAGCAGAARISLLLLASLVVTGTTSSEDLARALNSLLAPLGRLGFPARDTATAASIALCFIPVIIDEYRLIHDAQLSRGAHLGSGGPVRRIRAWAGIFTPLLVNLFRRADRLATALDARCYR